MKFYFFIISILPCLVFADRNKIYGPVLDSSQNPSYDWQRTDEQTEVADKIYYYYLAQKAVPREQRPESSPSSPPLATDDPGTPGRNGYELSIITDCVHATGRLGCESGINAAFGIGDKVQLRIAKAVTLENNSGESQRVGLGSTDVGVKWRFYDNGGWQIATFPSFRLNDASRFHNPDGTVIEPEGSSIYIPVIISHELGRDYTAIVNVGYRSRFDHPENNSLFTSVALGRHLGKTSRGMIELASEGNGKSRETDVRVGFIKWRPPKESGRYRLSFSTSVGHSLGQTPDGKPHMSILLSVTLAKLPN